MLYMGYSIYGGRMMQEPSLKNIFSSILLACLCLILPFFLKEKEKKISICPKCKEAFNYNELEDGKCKYCKNVDTVDIKQYYKHNQHKQDEKI